MLAPLAATPPAAGQCPVSLTLEAEVVQTPFPLLLQATEVVEAGAGYRIESAAGVELRAPLVVLSNGFSVGPEALFSAVNDAVADCGGPQMEITSPAFSPVILGLVPEILVSYSDAGGVDLGTFHIELDGVDITAACAVNSGLAACPPPALGEGFHTIEARIADVTGNYSQVALTFEAVSDLRAPAIEIVEPEELVIGVSTPQIVLEFSDGGAGIDTSSLVVLLDQVDVTASCAVSPEGATCDAPPLATGGHFVSAEISDLLGNRATTSLAFQLTLDLEIQITDPQIGFLTSEDTVTVSGVVFDGADSVEVAGVPATVAAGSFTAVGVPLVEGANQLTAVARTAGGGIGTATVAVIRDTDPPRIVIDTPGQGFVTTQSQIVVAGEVVDLTSSAAERKAISVFVNGHEAQVENRTFVVEDFLLQPGPNTIVAECTDAAGNTGSSEVTVELVTTPVRKLEELLGNIQKARVTETLPKPLIVRLTDANGGPLPGRDITFSVTRGNGAVMEFPVAERELTVKTDDQGRAEVQFALGTRAGSGNHEVMATSPGFPGAVVFCASADPLEPEKIVPIQAERQTGAMMGAVGEPLANPLFVQVFDPLGNPVPDLEVTFSATAGGGSFAGSQQSVAITDEEGKASAVWTLGPEPGINNNLAEATFAGLALEPAGFVASAKEMGVEADTVVSGIVLDGQDDPVPGATVRIVGTALESISDADGRFSIAGAPVGAIHLKVDGSTITLPGDWPTLSFHFTTVPGVDNDLGMPVRLLTLDTPNAKIVGGPDDVTLYMDGVPGSELKVFANSVTFPDGSKTGLLSFTQVHNDKVPMAPPRGSVFQIVSTIQPAGVRFDPPAQLSIPNLGGAPGDTVEIYSFDHDLGEFLSIGTAEVSPDAQRMISRPGFGVIKSGWHSCVPDVPTSNPCKPGACTTCGPNGPTSQCTACEKCGGSGGCEPREIEGVTAVADGKTGDGEVKLGVDQSVSFTAQIQGDCGSPMIEWSFGDGQTGQGETVSHTFTSPGEKTVSVDVSCDGCESAGSASDTITVGVFEIKVDSLSPAMELLLGEDLTINYTINGPSGDNLSDIELRIQNESDQDLFKTSQIAGDVGSHQATWEKGKLNQGGFNNAFANPNGGDYKVLVVATEGGQEIESNDDKTIKTKLEVEAEIEDKPGAGGAEAAGLDDLDQILKIVFKNGSNETIFTGGSLTIQDQGDAKMVKVDDGALNTLEDGEYDVLFRDLRDDIGNFSDSDDAQQGVQPIKFTLELRSSPGG